MKKFDRIYAIATQLGVERKYVYDLGLYRLTKKELEKIHTALSKTLVEELV